MHTKEELLYLAGKLAMACESLLNSNARTLGFYLNEMAKALDEYNNAILSNVNEKENDKY